MSERSSDFTATGGSLIRPEQNTSEHLQVTVPTQTQRKGVKPPDAAVWPLNMSCSVQQHLDFQLSGANLNKDEPDLNEQQQMTSV